jgi:hypothetical protein
VQGDPRITKDGKQYANRVIFDANDAVQATYPTTAPAANSAYPLVETVIKDSQVQDQVSAENAAKARYEFSRNVPRLVTLRDGLQLQPNVPLTMRELIAGVMVNIDTEGLCYEQRETFRLGGMDVEVAGGVEKIKLAMQPTGPAETLADIEDPVL